MSTLTERTDADILDAAADRIERDGWMQGSYAPHALLARHNHLTAGEIIARHNPPCCASGAIRAEGGRRAWEVLERMLRHLGMSTPGWNDEPGRTKEEVVAALRAAAAQARGGES